jgi:hypothetical protein
MVRIASRTTDYHGLPNGEFGLLNEASLPYGNTILHNRDTYIYILYSAYFSPVKCIFIRARIFKLLRSPRIDSTEPIPPGCVAW